MGNLIEQRRAKLEEEVRISLRIAKSQAKEKETAALLNEPYNDRCPEEYWLERAAKFQDKLDKLPPKPFLNRVGARVFTLKGGTVALAALVATWGTVWAVIMTRLVTN